MQIKSFDEWMLETKIRTTKAWSVLVLDNGSEIMVNTDLLLHGIVQLAVGSERNAKNFKFDKNNPIGSIEQELGQKLDTNDKNTQKFINLLPCSK